MKNTKFQFKFLIYAILFISISNISKAKNFDKINNIDNISNYFNGVLSISKNDYKTSYKFLKKIDGLEDQHYRFSQYYQFSLIASEKFNEAFKYSQKLEKKEIDNFESNLFSGIYNLKNKNYKEAALNFNNLKKLSQPQTIQGFISKTLNAWVSFDSLNNVKEATKVFKDFPERFKYITDIEHVFALCYFNSPKTSQVFVELTSNKKKNFARYIFFHANYLLSINNSREAIKVIDSGLNLNPRNIILSQLKKNIKSKNDLSDKFDCKSQSDVIAEIFYVIANVLAAQENHISSNLYINLAKYLNPNFTSYDILKAENFYAIDQTFKAKNIYKKILNNGVVYEWHATKKIAQILTKDKKNKEAIEFVNHRFDKIKSPGLYEIYSYADFLKTNEKYKEAIKYYTKLLNLINKNHELYPRSTQGRGIAYERIDQWNKAEKDFLNSLSALPEQAYVINYLAYSWIEKGMHIEKSLAMLEKANKLKVNDGYITDSLGWALFKIKRFKEAQKYLQLAVSIMPSDPVINEHYGDSLWMNNYKIQARYYWNYVLNLETAEKKQKEKVKEKLLYGLKI